MLQEVMSFLLARTAVQHPATPQHACVAKVGVVCLVHDIGGAVSWWLTRLTLFCVRGVLYTHACVLGTQAHLVKHHWVA